MILRFRLGYSRFLQVVKVVPFVDGKMLAIIRNLNLRSILKILVCFVLVNGMIKLVSLVYWKTILTMVWLLNMLRHKKCCRLVKRSSWRLVMLDLSNVTATTIDELREAFNVDSDAFYIRLIDDYLAWFLYLEGGN